jgi:hypothetical protein
MLWHDTPIFSGEIDSYIERWCNRSIQANPNVDDNETALNEFYSHMYENLDSLDSKAGAVLQLNGFVLALHGIVFSNKDTIQTADTRWLLLIGLITSVLAAYASLMVVRVIWSSSRDLEGRTFDDAVRRVVRIRSWRTIFHRSSIGLICIALAIFAAYSVFVMKSLLQT